MGLDTSVRYAGWIAELVGLVLVGLGLRRTRARFAPDRSGALGRLGEAIMRGGSAVGGAVARALVKAHLRTPTPIERHSGTAYVGGTGMETSIGRAGMAVVRGGSTEDRLKSLETQLDQLERKQVETLDALARERRERAVDIETERAARDDDVAKLRAEVADVAAGSLALEGIGLAFLIFGSVCTSVPDGVAVVLRLISPG